MEEKTKTSIKICVSGAAKTDHCSEKAFEIGEAVGSAIARAGCILLDGATTGFPYWASKGAKGAGGMVIGFSPALSEKEHLERYNLPLDYRDMIIYTGLGYSGRNLILTRAADAVVVGCGRIGTVNEFTHAFEDRKPIGVLEGEWETDELLKYIVEQSNRAQEMKDKIVFESNPEKLITRLVEIVKKQKSEGSAIDIK
ncbi:MAG: hypothetical protein COT89_01695 [Candidatus Colwellbacteria bacterium CG10_big_fil_rev_8_21_14_0_10_42_22]|uniref:Uncharacterized protein n=1 Tax=Candidatus Colwellbacteria bacterium CG10_big_fil_rev_8_21_14_0_10_42_22 TaxID=1974540 RepID=A0A2H0VFR3_9BACT|nr:MAG: hypothetical protein COT89_01695 [Candidatus Colwellbacteria bacterium CG10_big_fil_rev_8_21_14_0_10_42_22]